MAEKRIYRQHPARRFCFVWRLLLEDRELEEIEQCGKSFPPKCGMGELLVWFGVIEPEQLAETLRLVGAKQFK